MPGANPREAYNNYAGPLKAVLSCVTTATIIKKQATGYGTESDPVIFAFARNPARLSESNLYGPELYLHFVQSFYIGVDKRTEGQFKAYTCMYRYDIINALDQNSELLCYHWEPRTSAATYPHMHIGFGVRDSYPPFNPKRHIPSGRVPIEDVIAFLINELRVEPLKHNWRDILADARLAFMKNKSW